MVWGKKKVEIILYETIEDVLCSIIVAIFYYCISFSVLHSCLIC